MIVARLTNPLIKIYYNAQLQPITVSGTCITASATEYVLGQNISSFSCRVGNIMTDEQGSQEFFKDFTRFQVNLSAEELSNWGTDDTECLRAIVDKLGYEIDEILNLEIPSTL